MLASGLWKIPGDGDGARDARGPAAVAPGRGASPAPIALRQRGIVPDLDSRAFTDKLSHSVKAGGSTPSLRVRTQWFDHAKLSGIIA